MKMMANTDSAHNSADSPSEDHRKMAEESAAGRPVACAVLTISDTRTTKTDKGGRTIRELLAEAGHRVIDHTIVRDEPAAIRASLTDWVSNPEIQVILTTGGTGIAKRDTTIEVVESILTSRLDGFGELFRMLSWDEVQSSAMLSRATGGLVTGSVGEDSSSDTFVFSMPGSTNAVRLGMTKLIIPELAHLIWERGR